MATLSIEVDRPVADSKVANDYGSSLMNVFIPELVKRRTGRLPSLRMTFSARPAEKQPVLPPSPPPPYVEPKSEEPENASNTESVVAFLHEHLAERAPSDLSYYIASEASSSGVRWKHVGEGCRLVDCAGREARSETEDPELARKMYVDGVGYLLQALPDLSPNEKAQLATYLPASLSQEQNQEPIPQVQILATGDRDQKNYVYQFMTVATMYGVLLVSFLLPLLEQFMGMVYRCDQRYHVSTRVADTTSQAVTSVAKKAFASLNDGKTGQIALGMTLYTIDGASRGILEGYAQALKRQGGVAT